MNLLRRFLYKTFQSLKKSKMNLATNVKSEFAPILLIAFNRAESTRRVIEALIASNVKEMYFSVDGPRVGVDADKLKVSQVIALKDEYGDRIKFITQMHEDNLGCRLAVTGAISWFLSQVDFGIILEDDCVPSKGFLSFASRMLGLYENDESIMHVGGSSYLAADIDHSYNHYFSSFHEVWGWATWARAWKHFQLNPGTASQQENELILSHFKSKEIARWFNGYLSQARGVTPSVWSTQWSLSIIKNHGIAVNPINNLVKNIGFNKDSTHGNNPSFSLYDQFHISDLSTLPDPPIVQIDYTLDKKRFEVISKTDPSLFITNKLNAWMRTFLIRTLPQSLVFFIRKIKSIKKRLIK